MERFNKFSTTFDDRTGKLLKHDYLIAFISIFLILYAGLVAPKLPAYILKWFDYKVVQLIFFFLIAFVCQKKPTVAVLAAVGFMVTLMALDKMKNHFELMTAMEEQNFVAPIVPPPTPEVPPISEPPIKQEIPDMTRPEGCPTCGLPPTVGSPVAEAVPTETPIPTEVIANKVKEIAEKLEHPASEEELRAITADVLKESGMNIIGNGEASNVMGVDPWFNPLGESYASV
jgi:hypothetical protein